MYAQVLLQAACGPQGPRSTDRAISEACQVPTVTVSHLRQTMATEGLEAALAHCPSRGAERVLLAMHNLNTHHAASL